jgi:hypothetical protein
MDRSYAPGVMRAHVSGVWLKRVRYIGIVRFLHQSAATTITEF